MIIAIDGPAGSGKSSVAKAVAGKLGFHYLDTGAMYRAVALVAIERGISLSDDAAVAAIAASEPIEFGHEPGEPLPSRVFIGGRDVTEAIRQPSVDDGVSAVARLGSVREAMVAQQRALSHDDVVVEGRDIGTVVFPDAELKVFLTASPEARARRRAAQQAARGVVLDEAGVLDSIERRDAADSSRVHSPLTPADDAIQVDTTDLSFDQVVEHIAMLTDEARS